jgi:hypothetical protein
VNIDPLKSESPSGGVGNVGKRSTRITTSTDTNAGTTDDAEMDNITQQNLLDMVKELPEVRGEVTTMGVTLANDPNYPSDEAIEKIATLMAGLEPGWMDAIEAEGDSPEA